MILIFLSKQKMSRGYLIHRSNLYRILEDGPLEKYYNIPDKINIKVESTDQENKLLLSILYSSSCEFLKIKELPFEMNRLIYSYLRNKIEINISISYPSDYPFKPPMWSMVSTKHNFKTLLDVNKYYTNLILRRNKQFLEDWSPAIGIASDILDFIQRINHFEEIILHH